jgi:hypothetical protein
MDMSGAARAKPIAVFLDFSLIPTRQFAQPETINIGIAFLSYPFFTHHIQQEDDHGKREINQGWLVQ